MVQKKSGKALLREEGLQRTDNNMEQTSWPVLQPINQKNYYVDFLKRDEQFLAIRTQQEEVRNKMIKQARDRDRALANGQVDQNGDAELDDDFEDEMNQIDRTIVIHPGSQNLRIGFAGDLLPKTVPMVIARKATRNESEEFGEPYPKRQKLDNGAFETQPEAVFGRDFADKFQALSGDLKTRMRMNKRKVLPQSREMVTSYNRRATYDVINEHNDTMHVEWTDVGGSPEYFVGKAALRIPDQSQPRYRLRWPIRHGWINERDYDSSRNVWSDIQTIIEESMRSELKMKVRSRKDLAEYSCVFVIPDYYERKYVTSLLEMAMRDMGFMRVCFMQESLAASFGAGFTTCCVVDIGAQKTSICCVEDGTVMEHSRLNLKFGGSDVTDEFVKMIIYNHFPYADIDLKRRYDWMLVEELKHRYSTIGESDIVVQLYDFHLRAPGQDTRKYTFKIYDEVAIPSLILFRPELFDHRGKLDDRRKLVEQSYDMYDGHANDPLSNAQHEVLTAIAPLPDQSESRPSEAQKPLPGQVQAKPNGLDGIKDETDSRRASMIRVRDADGTPAPSGASSPARPANDGTPRPEASQRNTPEPAGHPVNNLGNSNGATDGQQPTSSYPRFDVHLERRDDLVPIYPLAHAVSCSINHAARGSVQKTRDLYGSLLLIGGASKVSGFGAHLESMLQGLLADLGYAKDVIVGRPPRELDPEMVVWKGGSVFGRMGRTNDSWITQNLYERLGERVLATKLMWAW